ncbi:MAG: FliH/SctL family protein [Buchnera aphidicola (Eriosoma harunire)]
MSNIINTKEWKRWRPNKCQELNSLSKISKKLSLDQESIVANENNMFVPLSSHIVADGMYTSLNNSNINIPNNIMHKDDLIEDRYNLDLKKKIEEEQKIFYLTIKKLIQDFQSALGVLDNMVSSRLLDIVLNLTKNIIGNTPELEKKVLLNTIKCILSKDIVSLQKLRLHIHPKNKFLVDSTFGEIINSYGWILFLDSSVNLYGCKISLLDGSELDYSIDNRLDMLSRLIITEEDK